MSARQAIRKWVVKYRTEQVFARSALALGAVIVAVIALVISEFAIYIVLLFWTQIVPLTATGAWWGSWIGLALLFGLYFVTDQRQLEKLEFESHGKLVAARLVARVTGIGFLTLAAGPKTMSSFVKVLCTLLLVGPSLTVACGQLIWEVAQLLRLNPDLVAQGLHGLAKSERRLPLSSLVKDLASDQAESLLQQLHLIDGVILRNGDPPVGYLTDSLTGDLRKACENRAAD